MWYIVLVPLSSPISDTVRDLGIPAGSTGPKVLWLCGHIGHIFPTGSCSTRLFKLDDHLKARICNLLAIKVLSCPGWFQFNCVASWVRYSRWDGQCSVQTENSVSLCLSGRASLWSITNSPHTTDETSVWTATLTICSTLFRSLHHLQPSL